MGLYDYVKCEAKLPKPEPLLDESYQTKSLDCILQTYVIGADKKLYLEEIGGRVFLSDFTGEIFFYAPTMQTGRIKPYTATFEDGLMVDVVLSHDRW